MSIWKSTAVLVGALLTASLTAQANGPKSGAAYWERIFADNHVLSIEFNVSKESWRGMQPTREGRSNKFSYVKADVTIDGKLFADAGLRFKGNSSYRASEGTSKRPLKIDLNRFVKKQKLHGRTKLNLSTSFLDPAYMKEKLGYELYRAAGMATPGVGWANVTLAVEGREKETLGIYVLIEQVDERFLTSNLGKATKGSLLMKPDRVGSWPYLGDDPKAYERFGIKLGEGNTEQISRFAALLKVIEEGSDEEFAREIGERMDLPQFAGYLAATSILASVDSYVGMPHNYYLLLDNADNKLRMLPWDLNETFGAFTMGADADTLTRWDIDRPWVAERNLVERLFRTESFPKLYRKTLAELFEKEFTEQRMFARIAAFEKALTPVLKANQQEAGLADLRMGIDGDAAGYNAAVSRRVFAIKPFIRKRIASIRAQLSGESEGEQVRSRRRRRR